MKLFRRFGRRWPFWLAALLVALATPAFVLRSQQEEWLRDMESGHRAHDAFFLTVNMPGGMVLLRRPPRETRPTLTQLIAATPANAELFFLRAQEAERQLDFVAAETDWKRYAELAADHAQGQLALADFYHRRLRPRDEVLVLSTAQGSLLSTDPLVPATEESAWHIFERIFELIEAHQLQASLGSTMYRVWMARYRREPIVRHRFFEFLLTQGDYTNARQLIATYRKDFPEDNIFPVRAQAALARRESSAEEALAVYDRAFRPLWPPELVSSYFGLLQETRRLRQFFEQARATVAANPLDLQASARLFYYYQQQGDLASAQQALIAFRQGKEARAAAWTTDELFVLARLFQDVHNYNEAARYYYALYSHPTGDASAAEKSLAGLVRILLTAPEQPVRFGAGNLSFYRDIATLDTGPGFLNGILSLLLNSTSPAREYAAQEAGSVAYFHRARAAELAALFDTRFPSSGERSWMHAELLQAYATYGDNEGVIREGNVFLDSFPKAPERTRVALLLAEAYARTRQIREEFALYDRLLEELAARAGRKPLGEAKPRGEAAPRVRSPEYARVLDRVIARLVALKRPLDALAIYRREVERNPNDAGLYERLATFLEQNQLGAELEETYRQALARFPDRTWYQRLARWYLRDRRRSEFEALTREVIRVFAGSELEEYFRQVVDTSALGPQLYLQVNLYAHQRFPHNLTFVRNLLNAYSRRETYDRAAWERLLRAYWFFDEGLRARFLEFLSSSGQLRSELDAVRGPQPPAAPGQWVQLARANPAAARFIAEAEAWQSHFEAAGPAFHGLTVDFPAEVELAQRAAALHRSLAYFDMQSIPVAANIERNLQRFDPRDRATLTRLGEIYAEHGLFDSARPYWNQIAQVEPGKSEGYLDAATVFWDYFQFDDALRLIEEGRKKLSQPALFAYEAGAIYENKRDYARAVAEYVQGALTADNDSPARRRLLRLARRPQLRELIEDATTQVAAGLNPLATAVALRAAVLEVQDRRADLEKFLLALAAEATNWELLQRLDQIAQQQGLDSVRQRSLETQIALATDPVERRRLPLMLVTFHEGREDLETAQHVLESLYEENSTILGVVRATVDFYWRHNQHERALAVLLRAVDAAYPALRREFLFEAARKATEAEQYERARSLLAALLADEPFQANYLAAMADSYAGANDDAGLRDFYLKTIQALETAPLPADERIERIAALRRGLIPALKRLNQPVAAVDQYIEIINRYAEDEALLQEAATYAQEKNLQERLLGYYLKAEAESPRDVRWPVEVARLETHVEHFPEAIAAYTRALRIRPNRTDLYEARAGLEERLLRFDDAAQSYTQLYELTYKNPHWMGKVAELRARQGRLPEVVEALEKALITGRPERPENFFDVAQRLDSWNFLTEARRFAEQGVQLAGSNLLTDSDYLPGARLYVRILTRLHEYEKALDRLQVARRQARGYQAASSFASALQEMGNIVARYSTPEEKAEFVAFLEQRRQASEPAELTQALLPLAQAAGLAELEVRWRYELTMARPGEEAVEAHANRLRSLQERRLQFAELGAQLEAYWSVYPPKDNKSVPLIQAAAAYQTAGDDDAELRVLTLLHQQNSLPRHLWDRYFELLLALEPDRLIAIAGGDPWGEFRNAATNFAIASGNPDVAYRATAARGRARPPVWTRAYTGLVGLHYADPAPTASKAFYEALGPKTVGAQVGNPVNRQEALTGDVWFYYASRYGEYLDVTHQGEPDDYLPAELEHTPGRADAYFELAEYYRESGQPAASLREYSHTLELDPNRGEAHDHGAGLLWEEGKREEATAHWREAFVAYKNLLDTGRVPETFWPNVEATLENIGQRGLLPTVRQPADRLLRVYVRRNGSYRVQPLLRGALAAAADPAAGVEWILDLSKAAPDQLGFLSELITARWMPESDKEPVYQHILALAEQQFAQAYGPARYSAEGTLRNWRLQWITYLLDTKQIERAQEALAAMSEQDRTAQAVAVAQLEMRLATRTSTLAELLERYRQQPEKAPPDYALQQVAATLRKEGEKTVARRLLDYLYTRQLAQRNFTAANFLGLAEVLLEEGDLTRALVVLQRMTMVASEAFDTLEPAATLLEKFKHSDKAVEFRAVQTKVSPWDAGARVRLAETLLAAGGDRQQALTLLAQAAAETEAPYETRVAAAQALGRTGARAMNAGSSELQRLATSQVLSPSEAEQPFFYYARLRAAESSTDPAVRLRLLQGAIALQPEAAEPRLALLPAVLAMKRYHLAVAAMEPLLQGSGLEYQLQRSEAIDEEGEPEESYEWYIGQNFLARANLTHPQRVAVARDLAEAYEQLRQWGAAKLMLRIALYLESNESARAELNQQLKSSAAIHQVYSQNAARRPVVTDNIEQRQVVRPRLPTKGVQQ